jgi:uncharacterized protein YndB with AHSA1/START domain
MTETAITITRVFDAPPERVWKEWTEPERFADWYGGADAECPLDAVEMDVRPGGDWRLTMFSGPARHEIHWKGEYQEVVEPERLAFTVTDEPDGDARELVTVVLTDLGDGRTEMLMTQSGGGLTPPGYEAAARGWGKFFDRMDERLAAG